MPVEDTTANRGFLSCFGVVVVGWLGRVSTILHCTHHLPTFRLRDASASFLLRICLLCVMFSCIFRVLPLLVFGQEVQLSMAAVRPLDLLARSPLGRASP